MEHICTRPDAETYVYDLQFLLWFPLSIDRSVVVVGAAALLNAIDPRKRRKNEQNFHQNLSSTFT